MQIDSESLPLAVWCCGQIDPSFLEIGLKDAIHAKSWCTILPSDFQHSKGLSHACQLQVCQGECEEKKENPSGWSKKGENNYLAFTFRNIDCMKSQRKMSQEEYQSKKD